MCDHQHRESFPSLRAFTPSLQSQTDAGEAALRYEQLGGEQEKELRRSLSGLQELICELLFENQKLRMSLLDTVANQSGEAHQ